MTDPPPRHATLLASTSSKIAAGLFAVIVLASISMVMAAARKSASPSPRTIAAASPTGTRAMPSPASAPRASLAPGETAQVVFQVTSLHGEGLITGRVLQPLTPTTLTRTRQTVTVELTPDATTKMGTSADIKPGALLQARGTADNNRTLHANSIAVLTGYVHLQAGEPR
jgi:hypothetical protein